MKAKELAGYLLENPDWNIEFWFEQMPDEIETGYNRCFNVFDVGDHVEHETFVLIGNEVEVSNE